MSSTFFRLPRACRILVVDDMPEITALVCEYLTGLGACAIGLSDGLSALVRLQVDSFDVLVVDLVMPRVNGWSILKFASRQSDLQRRTIVLTGDQYRIEREPQVALLPREVLYKPFQLDELGAAVWRVMRPAVAVPA